MTEPFRIATFNVKRLGAHERARIGAIAALVAAQAPDALALEEVEAGAALAIAEQTGLPHCSFVAHAQHRARGVAVLHRTPAESRSGERVPARWLDDKGFTRVVVRAPSGAIEIVALHLDWLSRAARTRQIARIAEHLGPATGARIVLGDLNAMSPRAFGGAHDDTPHALARALGLRVRESAPATFPSARPRWALDWILTCDALETAELQVIPTELSDHAMLIAELLPSATARAA